MKYLEAALLAVVGVFAPIKAALIVVICLVIVDLVTGIVAARKRGEPITSSGIKRTVGKVLLYELAICLAFLCQQYLTGDLFPASKLVTALVGMTELASVLENLDTIMGTSMFKVILNKLVKSQEDLEK